MTHVASLRKNCLFDPISGCYTPIRPSPTSALWCEEPLENQGPVDFSVTMRLASLPGFYWTYDLCRHPKRLVQNSLIWLGCPATTNPQNSVLVGRQNDRRDLVLRQQVAHRPP